MKIEFTLHPESRKEIQDIIREVIQEEIEKMTFQIPTSLELKDNEALLTRKEAMELIKCSHSTLYRYQKEGVVPYFKIGKKVLFKKGALLESMQILSNR
nr:helix-turn-helix domain-containing protein [uncultured Carboxylicivirga sp.]